MGRLWFPPKPEPRDNYQRGDDGTYRGPKLTSRWFWFRAHDEMEAHLGSVDDVASFAPRGCRLTIQYAVSSMAELAEAHKEHAKITEWLAEKKIKVTFDDRVIPESEIDDGVEWNEEKEAKP